MTRVAAEPGPTRGRLLRGPPVPRNGHCPSFGMCGKQRVRCVNKESKQAIVRGAFCCAVVNWSGAHSFCFSFIENSYQDVSDSKARATLAYCRYTLYTCSEQKYGIYKCGHTILHNRKTCYIQIQVCKNWLRKHCTDIFLCTPQREKKRTWKFCLI